MVHTPANGCDRARDLLSGRRCVQLPVLHRAALASKSVAKSRPRAVVVVYHGQRVAGGAHGCTADAAAASADKEPAANGGDTRGAASASNGEHGKVIQMLQTTLHELKASANIPAEIKGMSASDLLELLQWEFKRLPLIHNAPLVDAAQVNDDTKMMTTLTNGYLQNVAQRYLLGVESTSNLQGEDEVMVDYLGVPPLKKKNQPTLREASACADSSHVRLPRSLVLLGPASTQHQPAYPCAAR